jgi:hypothetical protein
MIERNFTRRLECCESFWFQVIQLFNKQIINRKDPQISMMHTFCDKISLRIANLRIPNNPAPQVTSRDHRDLC